MAERERQGCIIQLAGGGGKEGRGTRKCERQSEREREIEREGGGGGREREKDRQADRQAVGTDRETVGQTNR